MDVKVMVEATLVSQTSRLPCKTRQNLNPTTLTRYTTIPNSHV